MKCIRIKENPRKGEILLIGLGDVHYGSRDCDIEKFEKMVKWIKGKENARVIIMGDMLDIALKDSVGGGTFDNTCTPEEQMDYMLTTLEPIKNKIWCMLSGNHGERIRERTSIDTDKIMARALGIPYAEHGTTFIKAKIGNINYVIYAAHGNTCSLSPAGKLNACLKMGNYIDADIYMMGHVHELMSHSTEYFKINIKDKMVEKDKRYYIITGHFLKYGGYAEQKGYAPGKAGVAKILLNAKEKDCHVSV